MDPWNERRQALTDAVKLTIHELLAHTGAHELCLPLDANRTINVTRTGSETSSTGEPNGPTRLSDLSPDRRAAVLSHLPPPLRDELAAAMAEKKYPGGNP